MALSFKLKVLLVTIALSIPGSAHAGCFALIACADARVQGIPELAAAVERAADVAEGLPAEIRAEALLITQDIDDRVMARISQIEEAANSTLENSEQIAARLIDETVEAVDTATQSLTRLIKDFFEEAKCSSVEITDRAASIIQSYLPSFSLNFWSSYSDIKITLFDGSKHIERYLKDDEFSQATAVYNSLTAKLDSALPTTEMTEILDLAAKRSDVAYEFYCSKASATGGDDSYLYDRWRVAVLAQQDIERLSRY